jgi:hypothetical protein
LSIAHSATFSGSATTVPLTAHALLHKSPDMHYVQHMLAKNTRSSHHVEHYDTQVPAKSSRGCKQLTVIRYA